MTTTIPKASPETEVLIQREMAANGRLDWYEAYDRINQRLQADASRKHAAEAAENKSSAWRIDPTELETLREMRETGGTFEDCHRRLSAQLKHDARRLSVIVPSVKTQISDALDVSAEAQQRASEILDDHRALLAEYEARVIFLGEARMKIHRLKALEFTEGGEKELAQRVIQTFLENLGPNRCPETAGAFRVVWNDLVFLKAIEPHIGPFLKQLEVEATKLFEELKSSARTENVNLKKLLSVMNTESRGAAGNDFPVKWPMFPSYEAINAFADLHGD